MRWWQILSRSYGAPDPEVVKARIRQRLKTEDYTRRLPRPPKPRVRYKLTTMYYRRYPWNTMRKVWA